MSNILEKIFLENVASNIYCLSLEKHPVSKIFKRERDFKNYLWKLKIGWIYDDYPFSMYYFRCNSCYFVREDGSGNQMIKINVIY